MFVSVHLTNGQNSSFQICLLSVNLKMDNMQPDWCIDGLVGRLKVVLPCATLFVFLYLPTLIQVA